MHNFWRLKVLAANWVSHPADVCCLLAWLGLTLLAPVQCTSFTRDLLPIASVCDWHWCHSVIRLIPPSLLVPHSHDVLIASTHTSYWQQPSEGTKHATSRPNPEVGSWSTSRQTPTRPGQWLYSHWTITANTAVKCRRSLSCRVNHHQLFITDCTQLMMLLQNAGCRVHLWLVNALDNSNNTTLPPPACKHRFKRSL